MIAPSMAEVVEWQTRTFEGRVAQAVRVQVPPSAPTTHESGSSTGNSHSGYVVATLQATHRRKGRRSFYARCIVPASLRQLLGRREIWRSLDTSDPAAAELRSNIVVGRTPALFLRLRKPENRTMTQTELRRLVSRYIGERLQDWEDALYSGEKPASDDLKTSGDWRDCLARFSESAVEDCAQALSTNDLSVVHDVAAECITNYKLSSTVKEGSPV